MNQRWNLLPALVALLTATGALTGCQTAQHSASKPQSKASQEAVAPAQALERLKAGNDRFVAGRPLARNLPAERETTAAGQYPYAVVLSCLDSRCSSELIFDQGLGDIFNARVAGNVLNDDILGSMEFACKSAGAKLIVVIGHSKCGAVKGACTDVQLGNLTGLLAKIKPAAAAAPSSDANHLTDAHVDAVAKENVKRVVAQIKERSPILAELVQSGKVGLIGGMYDLKSGKVAFLE